MPPSAQLLSFRLSSSSQLRGTVPDLRCRAKAGSLNHQALEWAKAVGGKFDKVSPASFRNLRGLKANGAIAKGEEMVSIPREHALWVTKNTSCPFPDWVDANYFKRAPWFVKLGLRVLHERRLGPESKLRHYIELLPEAVDTPHFWSEDERQALQCEYARESIAQQSRAWAEQHAELISCSPQCGVSRADFDWALSCVVSRTFSGPYVGTSIKDRLNILLFIAGATALSLTFGLFPEDRIINAAVSAVVFNLLYELILSRNISQYAMCPIIDLFNHDGTIESEVSYDYFRDGYSVIAGRQFNSGDQVFISYGKQTSDSLLQYYGFVEEGNSNDTYAFADFKARLSQISGVSAERLALLQSGGDATVKNALDVVVITSKGQVDDSVKIALRYVLGAAASLDAAQDKVSNAKDALIWSAVLAVCEAEYAQGATLSQLKQAAKDAVRTQSERHVLIHQYNIVKKKFLLTLVEKLKLRVTTMKA